MDKGTICTIVMAAPVDYCLPVPEFDWRSADTWLISFSECGDRQEAMLLLPVYGWIHTQLGRFVLEPEIRQPWLARIVLASVEPV